jgi:hypothetical protein
VVDAWAKDAATKGMMSVRREKDENQNLSCLSFLNKSQIQLKGDRSWLNPFESCELKLVQRVDLKIGKCENYRKCFNDKSIFDPFEFETISLNGNLEIDSYNPKLNR